MTREELDKAIALNKEIYALKKTIKIWGMGISYHSSEVEINIETGIAFVSICDIISFDKLKQIALEMLNNKLKDCVERFENL